MPRTPRLSSIEESALDGQRFPWLDTRSSTTASPCEILELLYKLVHVRGPSDATFGVGDEGPIKYVVRHERDGGRDARGSIEKQR